MRIWRGRQRLVPGPFDPNLARRGELVRVLAARGMAYPLTGERRRSRTTKNFWEREGTLPTGLVDWSRDSAAGLRWRRFILRFEVTPGT